MGRRGPIALTELAGWPDEPDEILRHEMTMDMQDMARSLAALDESTRRTMLEARLQGLASRHGFVPAAHRYGKGRPQGRRRV